MNETTHEQQAPNTAATSKTSAIGMRGLLISIVVNALVPFALYTLSKRFISPSEVIALSIAAIFPLVDSVFEIIRHRSMDIIAALALLGIAVSLFGVALGGDPKILLIRESFLTFGLARVLHLAATATPANVLLRATIHGGKRPREA